jgi:hypothetical protein
MNDQDNIDRELGRALHRQADGIGGVPISFEQVKGTARGIRRRRALAATAAVAAAVAIIVPTALVGSDLLGGKTSDDGTPPIATQSTNDTTTGNVTGRDELDARNLEPGDAPAMVWLDGRTLHDGSQEIQLDRAYDGVAWLNGRYVVTANDEGDRTVTVLRQDGAPQATYPLSGGITTNDDGSIVAWGDPEGGLWVLQPGLDEPLRMVQDAEGSNLNVVGVVGDDCTTDPETTVGGGCSVIYTLDGPTGERSSYASSSHGFSDRAAPRGQAITAVSAIEQWIAITEVRDDGTCSQALDDGTLLFKTCDYRGLAYSPDGSRLLAHDDYGDGFGDTQVSVLDANTGGPLVDLKSTEDSQAFVFDQVWEDEEHLLAVAFQQGQWSVVRFGLDGSREYAVEPVPGGDADRPFFLER